MLQTETNKQQKVRGRPFQKGHDPRRHIFTPSECSEGFFAALASIATKTGRTPYGTLQYFVERRAAQIRRH